MRLPWYILQKGCTCFQNCFSLYMKFIKNEIFN